MWLPFFSGEGVGSSPACSAWSSLISLITSNTNHWLSISDGLYMPLILSFSPSEEDLALFIAYGIILKLSLLHGYSPLPISLFIILYLLHGFAAATNANFIQAIAPNAHTWLSTWPLHSIMDADGNCALILPLGQDLINMIFEHIPNVQLCAWLTSSIQTNHFTGLTHMGIIITCNQRTKSTAYSCNDILSTKSVAATRASIIGGDESWLLSGSV